jgi:putative ABC transport system permease protein
MLRHSFSQSLLTVAGISVSFFLTSALTGLFIGWCNTTSDLIRHADADIWLMAKQTPALDYGTAIPRQRIYQARSIPGVATAQGLFVGWNYWQTPDGRRVNVVVVGLDDDCAGGPWLMREGSPDVVHLPSSVIVDDLFRSRLRVNSVGEEIELQSRRAVVRGFSSGVRSFTASPYVFTSLKSAIRYDRRYRDDQVTYVLIKCAEHSDPLAIQGQLAAQLDDVDVLTTAEFARRTTIYWMLETGAGITVAITALLGLVVGTVITSQTLFSLTQNHLPEYAVLLALGFSRWQLAIIAAWQSAFLGAAGVAVGALGFFATANYSANAQVTLESTPMVFGLLVAVSLGCSLLSSLLSVRSIFAVDPIHVFHA